MTTVVIDRQYDRTHLEALARAIFYFGALASLFDGLLTWLVVRSAGTNLERNSFMGYFMVHIGVATTCALRVLLGVACFWYIANLIVGRRIFLFGKRAARYQAKLATAKPRTWVPYLRSIETIFVLGITWAVVGNNIQACIIWFSNGHSLHG
jgi:hypothetical protein